MTLSMIWAQTQDGLIGNNFALPWQGKLKDDMQWFKDKTKNKLIVYGYSTFKSFNFKPLPNRVNVVISNNHFKEINKIKKDNLKVFKSIEDFRNYYNNNYKLDNSKINNYFTDDNYDNKDIVVIGGSQIYNQFLKYADILYVTIINASLEGDTYIDILSDNDFQLVSTIESKDNELVDDIKKGKKFNHDFFTYRRVKNITKF